MQFFKKIYVIYEGDVEESSLVESVPVEEGPGAARAASPCPGALSASLANDEGQIHLFGKLAFATLYFFLQGFLDEVENGGAQLDLLQEQVEVQGSEEFVPDITLRHRENESEVNNSQSETSGGPLLFLEISTENDEDNSSEKQIQLATERVNTAMINLDTSTSSLSSQEPSVEKCRDCDFDAYSKYEMNQHRIKSHKKSNFMKKSSRKKKSTKRSSNEYSDTYLDEILNDC